MEGRHGHRLYPRSQQADCTAPRQTKRGDFEPFVAALHDAADKLALRADRHRLRMKPQRVQSAACFGPCRARVSHVTLPTSKFPFLFDATQRGIRRRPFADVGEEMREAIRAEPAVSDADAAMAPVDNLWTIC
jgi:hypothetical protein